jgi:hypothetical protein
MPQFILKITLGNDAMKSHIDVARALNDISMLFEYSCEEFPAGKVRDINGNTVGSWVVK